MKRLLLFELLLIFIATTFESDSPPGWYQQVLPVNETVRDIFFIDSLTGWAVSSNQTFPANDTGYIMKTTNGGNTWTVQLDSMFNYYSIQFLDVNNGFAAGGTGRAKFLKTTNGGSSWLVTTPFGNNMFAILDMSFVNRDTGWICSDDSFGGGIYKTTNGGLNWLLQAPVGPYKPIKLSFINKDTGWAGSNESNGRLFRTTNGGVNWNTIYVSSTQIQSLFFLNGLNGWIRAGTSNSSIQYSTNGGFNWFDSQGSIVGGFNTQFINDSIGYSGTYTSFKILKSTNGGRTWGYQNTPLISGNQLAVIRNDTLNAWASQIMHTSDGGGQIFLGITQINNEVPSEYKLYQNYPNPFNPKTIIRFQINRLSDVNIKVYDIQGKFITELVNQKQAAGTYEVDFDGSKYSSGVYFYKLTVTTGKEAFTETKKMLMLK